MSKILSLRMEGPETLVVSVHLYLDIRLEDKAAVRELIYDGLRGLTRLGPWELSDQPLNIRVDITESPVFSLNALNMRVYDKTPVRRGFLNPRINVSRAYYFSAWPGLFKFERRLLRFPDVFINLGGRDMTTPAGYKALRSVVLHEFGHVLGFADKYRGRKGKKKHSGVSDRDLMYRTGDCQSFLPYQIRLLYDCARRERLTIKRV